MHEYSIVQALLEQVEQIASQNNATKITKVVVKIGIMSGVEPHLLEMAFDTFKEKSICDGAAFVMNIQPLLLECNLCHAKSEQHKAEYICKECGSVDIRVLDGEEMFLMQLEMEEQ